MLFEEIKDDLFKHTNDRIPVHCISQDCRMGAGIAVDMKREYNLSGLEMKVNKFPDCIYFHNVLNLVTKKCYWEKPTYQTLEQALIKMREVCETEGITRIVMPRIASGLDALQWPKVRWYIQDVFKDANIDILVCSI